MGSEVKTISILNCDLSLEARMVLIVALFGALGGLVHSLRSFYWYLGNRELVWSRVGIPSNALCWHSSWNSFLSRYSRRILFTITKAEQAWSVRNMKKRSNTFQFNTDFRTCLNPHNSM